MPPACMRLTTLRYPTTTHSPYTTLFRSLIPSSQITWVSPDRPSTSRSSRSTAAGPEVGFAPAGITTPVPAMASFTVLMRVRIERLLAAGASIKGAARKFAIDYHALRRHWRNHVSAEARAAYIAGAGATRDQLEEIVADETLALIDHYRIVRGALYQGFGAAEALGDGNSLALLAGRLHENFRDSGRLTGELQRGPLLSVQSNVLINPDYTRAIARIVSAVGRYPEAREAVVAALRDLDAASGPAPPLIDHRAAGDGR